MLIRFRQHPTELRAFATGGCLFKEYQGTAQTFQGGDLVIPPRSLFHSVD